MGLGDYFSHYPVLAAAVARTKGPVLELGCGYGSTYMLHYMCAERFLVTADTNLDWLHKFSEGYACPRKHEFIHVDKWEEFSFLEATKWSVAFVDNQPGEMRTPLIRRLKGRTTFIVAHDSERDYDTGANYKYEEVIPLFKYVSEWKRVRPYTLILSDEQPFPIEPCDTKWNPKDP